MISSVSRSCPEKARSRTGPVLLPVVLAVLAVLPGRTPPPGRTEASGRAMGAPPARPADPGLEIAMRERVLRDRREAGHGRLAWDPALATIAREHSRDMLRRGYLGHVSPEGAGPGARLRAAGYTYRNVRENVARAPTVGAAEDGFLASPHHRGNLMADDVTRFGIGVVRGSDRGGGPTLYVTQLFATPYAPPEPGAVAEALLGEIREARARAGAPRLRPLAALSAVARRHVDRARPPLTRETLMDISREALARSDASVRIASVSVSTQTVLEASDLDVPPPALRPEVRYVGVAAVRAPGQADGQPSVLVLLLVAEGAP